MAVTKVSVMHMTVEQKKLRITEIECEFDVGQEYNEFFYRTARAQKLRDEYEILIRSLA